MSHGITWAELAERVAAFNAEYGIKRQPDLRQISDMCFALGAEPQLELHPRDSSIETRSDETAQPAQPEG